MSKDNIQKKVLVIGSINLDHCLNLPNLPQPGETLMGRDYKMVSGGKGANQAVACARLGANTRFIANIGDDSAGSSMLSQFQDEGIDTSLIEAQHDINTGVALIFIDDNAENVIGISAGANACLSAEQIHKNRSAIQTTDYLLMQLEVPLEALEAATKLARLTDTITILNPAPARALSEEFLSQIDIITPNQSEAESITSIEVKDEKSADAAALWLHKRGIQIVIITMGSAGAYYSNNQATRSSKYVEGVKAKAIDTTAAGDTFNGAFVVGLCRGLSYEPAVMFANQCAAISVTRAGAQPSVPYYDEVKHLLMET